MQGLPLYVITISSPLLTVFNNSRDWNLRSLAVAFVMTSSTNVYILNCIYSRKEDVKNITIQPHFPPWFFSLIYLSERTIRTFAPLRTFLSCVTLPNTRPKTFTGLAARGFSPELAGVGPKKIQKACPSWVLEVRSCFLPPLM